MPNCPKAGTRKKQTSLGESLTGYLLYSAPRRAPVPSPVSLRLPKLQSNLFYKESRTKVSAVYGVFSSRLGVRCVSGRGEPALWSSILTFVKTSLSESAFPNTGQIHFGKTLQVIYFKLIYMHKNKV